MFAVEQPAPALDELDQVRRNMLQLSLRVELVLSLCMYSFNYVCASLSKLQLPLMRLQPCVFCILPDSRKGYFSHAIIFALADSSPRWHPSLRASVFQRPSAGPIAPSASSTYGGESSEPAAPPVCCAGTNHSGLRRPTLLLRISSLQKSASNIWCSLPWVHTCWMLCTELRVNLHCRGKTYI